MRTLSASVAAGGLLIATAVASAPSSDPPFLVAWGSAGSGDGQFSSAHHLATAPDGRTYVGDLLNNRVQEFDASGTFLRKWAVPAADGIAVSPDGSVVVIGTNAVFTFTADGVPVTSWGSSGSGNGQFNSPTDVAVDGDGNVYVVEVGNHRVQKFTSSGGYLGQWGSQGSGDGQFTFPLGIAIAPGGDVYVADVAANRIQRFTADGTFVSAWGTAGSASGDLQGPGRPVIDADGRVIVPESGNNRLSVFTTDGTFLTLWGQGGSGEGQFAGPTCVAEDGLGNVYVMDKDNARVQKFGAIPLTLEPATWGRVKLRYH